MDIFVISPYTDDDFTIIEARAWEADKYVGELTRQGKVCYSAISAMHHLLQVCQLPGTWDYWKMHCETMMMHAYEVHVLCLDGWEESEGVHAEIEIAKMFNKKITYVKKTGKK
jgi:hypothetical protein